MSQPERQAFGKYQVVRLVGEGAMGTVYQAYDPSLERHVALKIIRKDLLDKKQATEMIARFRNEAMAAGRLAHPGIVAVYDFGEDDSTSFIVMEFAPGEDLEAFAQRYAPLGLAEVSAIMGQLLDALNYAHQAGVVHRDVKPSNILVTTEGKLKITDFGIARIASSKLTQTGTILGTPMYMAPEQYMGTGVDQRADLFSAGVLFYELLTGKRPFDGETVQEVAYKICHADAAPPSQLNSRISAAVDAVALKALSKDKAARYPSGRDLARAIAGAISGQSMLATGQTLTPKGTGRPTAIAQGSLDRIAEALVAFVGPIAKVLVKKTAAQSRDHADLCSRLAAQLGSDAERTQFLKKVGG